MEMEMEMVLVIHYCTTALEICCVWLWCVVCDEG